MQRTYTFDTIGVEYDNHPVVAQTRQVEKAFSTVGIEVDLMSLITPHVGSEPHQVGLKLTPDLSEPVEEVLDQIGWLSVGQHVSESFEDDKDITGSQEMTNVVVRRDLTVIDVVEMLSETGYSETDDTDMLTKVRHTIDMVRVPSDPDTVQIMAYDVLRKSLGWLAEKLLAETDHWYKMPASRDPQGYDLGPSGDNPFDTRGKDGFQLKTMQRVTSQSLHKKEHEIPHISYAWTHEGIHVADMEEREGTDNQAKAIADAAGLRSGTIVKKSEEVGETKDYGRPARVIAWE